MANIANPAHSTIFVNPSANITCIFYAVYDCCITNNIPSQDVAFIEQRVGRGNIDDNDDNDEQYFQTLSDAKAYVNGHFKSGAEYFSLNQSADPDNILPAIIDKITYMIA